METTFYEFKKAIEHLENYKIELEYENEYIPTNWMAKLYTKPVQKLFSKDEMRIYTSILLKYLVKYEVNIILEKDYIILSHH